MKNSFFVFIFLIIFLSIFPFIKIIFLNDGNWSGIIPSFVDDDLYYYARIQNVAHGYAFVGNPYFFEHRNGMSPAFFFPDWISVLPTFLGFSFLGTVLANLIFWSVAFAVLVYFLLKQLDVSKRVSMLGSLFTYLSIFSLLLRPVSMQIIAPFFVAFLLSFVIWINNDKDNKWKDGFFIFTTAVSFYLYAYLWQIVVIILGVTFLYLLFCKNFVKTKNLVKNSSIIFLLIIPSVLYTFKQIKSQNYWETMKRIGLIDTHIPTFLSIYDSIVISTILIAWLLIYLFIKNIKNDEKYFKSFVPLSIIGVGIFISLFTNIITGKELEISNHIERFMMIWTPISLATLFWFIYKHRNSFEKKVNIINSLLIATLVLSLYFTYGLFKQGFNYFSILNTESVLVQKYSEPIDWLNKNVPEESVVWSNGNINYYIPIMTKNFVLFSNLGGLHLVSDGEMQERYLVSNYFHDLNLSNIKDDFRQYAGVGNAIHESNTLNRKVKICSLVRLELFGVDCGLLVTSVSLRGEEYFINLEKDYNTEVKSKILEKLKKYNVTYVLKDKTIDDSFKPASLKGSTLLWYNDFFEIYKIQYINKI